jgi:ribosomal protein S18 acetylase RimI-like enzyme
VHVEGLKAFIYDIEVREEQRRRGYGRELLDAGASAAVELGATTLGLNVFGPNDGARALYERAGYATTEQTYRIEL